MKTMTKIILIAGAVLFATQATAQMKVQQSQFIEQQNGAPVTLKATGNSVDIAFDIDIERHFISSDEACVIIPRFVKGGFSEDLPAIIIEGYRYSVVAQERKRFDKALLPTDVAKVNQRIAYCGEYRTIHYQVRLPYDTKLKGATLVLDQSIYGLCGIGTGPRDANGNRLSQAPSDHQTMVLANGVVDNTDFRVSNPVQYYYPNRIAGSYENDFSNVSVFKLNSKTIDMDAFVNNGYADFKAEMQKLMGDKNTILSQIDLFTSASPDGKLSHNEKLAEARANAIAKYIVKDLKLPESLIHKSWTAENWDAFVEDLHLGLFLNRAEIEEIINSTDNLDERERKLRKLDNWWQINDVFQTLRNCHITVDYTTLESFPEMIQIGVRELAVVEIGGEASVSLEKTEEFYNAEPRSRDKINNMMVALTEVGRFEEAKKYADMIPNRGIDPLIANNKGVLYMLSGEIQMAKTMFELAKETPMADYNMGLMYLFDNQPNNAADILDSFNNVNSTVANIEADRNEAAARNTHIDELSAESYYLRAIAYTNDKHYDNALKALEKAIELNPSFKEKALNQAEFIIYRTNDKFIQITSQN